MTVAEIRAYTGTGHDGRAKFLAVIDGHNVAAWTEAMAGRDGWWWAITTQRGGQEVVVGLGWSAGSSRDMKHDVERKLLALRSMAHEVAS